MRKREINLTQGPIIEQLLMFFFPVLFGTLFQQLYNTVDAIVVGNYVGTAALGAVGGSTGTLLNLRVGFVTGLSSGATVVIAQYYGEGRLDGVKKAVDSGMFLAVWMGFIMMIGGFIFAPQLLHMLNVPADVFPYSLVYLRIYFVGMIPTMLYNQGASILRAVGDSKRPLYFLIASCATNIVLDITFVAIIPWGVLGAAWATVISQVVSALLTMFVLSHTHEAYQFHLRDLSFDPQVLKRIIIIGLPTGIQGSLYSIANLFIQASINTLGTATVAAYTAFGKIDAMFWNASGALGTAVITFTGQNFGAGNIKRVREGFAKSIFLYVIGALSISLICFFGSPILYRLFTPDAQVISIGVQIIRYMCPWWVSFVFVEIFSSGIRACGDSLIPMVITAFGIGALRIIWILCAPKANIYDMLVCYPVSWVLTSLLFLVYFLQGGWLKRSLALHKREI